MASPRWQDACLTARGPFRSYCSCYCKHIPCSSLNAWCTRPLGAAQGQANCPGLESCQLCLLPTTRASEHPVWPIDVMTAVPFCIVADLSPNSQGSSHSPLHNHCWGMEAHAAPESLHFG